MIYQQSSKNKVKKTIRKWYRAVTIGMVVLGNLICLLPVVCDWYAAYLFPHLSGALARFNGLFPCSVGEWMIVLGILLLIMFLFGWLEALFCRKLRTAMKKFSGFLLDVLLAVLLLLTLNWTMINRCTPIMESDHEFRIAELERLRDTLVVTANQMAKSIEREEDGTVAFHGDVQEEARKAMLGIADCFPQLQGFYPKVKPMMFSDLMSQSRMLGYYFPFSMEANYNNRMYRMNYPSCFCHELSHVKGIMREDEANFLAYLACIRSENPEFQYSGILSVLYYVDNAFYENVGPEYYSTKPQISQQVRIDNQFLTPEAMAQVEKNAVLPSETVKKYSDSFNEATIKMGGVADGMASYDRVTKLLLIYYEDQLKAN